MRGRKPTTIEQRILTGNPQRRPLPLPVQVGGRPDPELLKEAIPPDLPDDGRALWEFAVDQLIEKRIADVVDLPALEGLCIHYARAKQAGRVVASEGHFTRGSQGQLKEHPALKIEREAWSLFWKMAEHFALTPVARTRLGLAALEGRKLQDELNSSLRKPTFEAA